MWRRVPRRSSVSSKFSDVRSRSGSDGRRHARRVRAAELVADRPQLALLEFADGDPPPPLGGADDGRVHQLQHRAFAEGVRNDLRPASLLEEEPLQQVRGAHDPAMPEREAQVGDARVEVVPETLHHRRQLPLVRLHEVLAQHRGEGRRRRLVTAARPQRDLRPPTLWGFAPEIAEPMHEAALAQRPREARLDGAVQHRRPRGGPASRRSAPPSANSKAIENSLRPRPAKASSSCHSRSVTWLTAVRLSTLAPLASRNAASMSRVLSPRANISTAKRSSSAVRPARLARTRETNGAARSATCGT